MIKDLIKLANHLDEIGLTKEADSIDGLLKKSFLLSFLMMGCQGKGDLEYNHFVWGIDKESGDFATTLEEGMVEAHYKIARIEYLGDERHPAEPEYNKDVKFAHIKISGLKKYLTLDKSFYQGRSSVIHYDDIVSGLIYEKLKTFEESAHLRLDKNKTFNSSDKDSFELIFLNESGDGYHPIPIMAGNIDEAIEYYFKRMPDASYGTPNVTIHDAE